MTSGIITTSGTNGTNNLTDAGGGTSLILLKVYNNGWYN